MMKKACLDAAECTKRKDIRASKLGCLSKDHVYQRTSPRTKSSHTTITTVRTCRSAAARLLGSAAGWLLPPLFCVHVVPQGLPAKCAGSRKGSSCAELSEGVCTCQPLVEQSRSRTQTRSLNNDNDTQTNKEKNADALSPEASIASTARPAVAVLYQVVSSKDELEQPAWQ